MGYQLICFDAGFTLIQPRRTTAETLSRILAEEDILPTEEALRRAWEAADLWFWEEYQRLDNNTWTSDERILATWRRHHGIMLQELEVDDPEHRIADAVVQAYALSENWQAYPDTLPALQTLRAAGFTIGVVSDWGTRLPGILEQLGIGRYLDFTLASASAGAAKPSPAFYRMAAEKGGVAAQQALMIGDSYRADVLGARSVAMDAVLLDRAGAAEFEDVPIIRSLEELPALVGSPLAK